MSPAIWTTSFGPHFVKENDGKNHMFCQCCERANMYERYDGFHQQTGSILSVSKLFGLGMNCNESWKQMFSN